MAINLPFYLLIGLKMFGNQILHLAIIASIILVIQFDFKSNYKITSPNF